MRLLNDAKIVLRILQENGYEGYIVGGAVRDYLLKQPMNDIDLTTNAKPYQVLKMFKGVETGAKYGTVTIQFKDNHFEVTTYRRESEYINNRHPGEVEFDATAEEDVQRRDFTMNGLLMDETGLIVDHVGGMNDIRSKVIRAIGHPEERFNEDALRMLRAFYFQSKLGFTIEDDTKEAIKNAKTLIKNVASERVLDEMLKIIQANNHLKVTFRTMVETGMHEMLPGLKEGIEHFAEMSRMPMTDAFFTTSFALYGRVPSYWKFSNRHRHKYQTVVRLSKMTTDYGAKELYEYGLEICQAANRVNYNLGKTKLQSLTLAQKFEELPIRSELDLKFRARDILKLTNKKAGAWMNLLITEMVNEVLDGKMKNDFDSLKKYVEDNYERF